MPNSLQRELARLEAWLHRPRTGMAILIGSLLLTAAAWWGARYYALDDAQQHFERRTDEIHGRIERRMAAYEELLRGGVGLFAARPEVSREAWTRYVGALDIETRYPGLQGFGFARLIPQGLRASHEAGIRAEGFPTYRVRPEGERALQSAIVYLEPFVARNLRAFGFDMLSESRRREAMLRARDSGRSAVSAVVTLVQEDGKDVQKGFLLYLPVYAVDPLTHEPRVQPDRLVGWVYAPFRVRDLMTGILGTDVDTVALHMHDGDAGPPAQAFYATTPHAATTSDSAFHRERVMEVGGRRWTLVYDGHDFEGDAAAWASNLVAVAGLSVDAMLYWSLVTLARRKRHVERQVVERTDALAARTAWLEAVSGLSPDAVLVFERDERATGDDDHRLVLSNPAFSQWLGWDAASLAGLTERELDARLAPMAESGHPLPALREGDAQVCLAGPPRRVLARGLRQGPRHRVYYFHDVTHRTEVETLKNEFLSTAAHELRTPLASVYGYAELLAGAKLPQAQATKAMNVLYRQAGVLKHLVDELLDLARLDARGEAALELQDCELHAVAEAAIESTEHPGTESRVTLQRGDTALPLRADPAKLHQVLVNLLSNALKYSPGGQAVQVSLTAGHWRGRPVAELRVADQGIGMTPEQVERAFERFYRADASGHVLGAGLGLAIVHEIVALHGGDVALDSEPGRGSTVTVRLPLEGAPASSPAAGAAPLPAPGASTASSGAPHAPIAE